ncbi:hypothetical protein [Paraburkholderia tropica]|nr:hypothetical protein [Paraburkholderia tropica]MDE1141083.1 hypothetical protein [Paraburkholderia tropica]
MFATAVAQRIAPRCACCARVRAHKVGACQHFNVQVSIMHDLPTLSSFAPGAPDAALASPPPLLHIAPHQVHWIALRRGAALVAVEGALCVTYRDAALALAGHVAPLQTRRLDEGERYPISDRGWYGLSGAGRDAAGVLIVPAAASPLVAWARRWIARLAGVTRLRKAPPRPDRHRYTS